MNRRYYGAALVLLWSTNACAATLREKTFDTPTLGPAQCVTVGGAFPGVKLDDALVTSWDTDRPELSVGVAVEKNNQVRAHVCNESTKTAAAGRLRVRTSGCK